MPPGRDVYPAFYDGHFGAVGPVIDVELGAHRLNEGVGGVCPEGARRIMVHPEEGFAVEQAHFTRLPGEMQRDSRAGVQMNDGTVLQLECALLAGRGGKFLPPVSAMGYERPCRDDRDCRTCRGS